ncbi:hypothetical protein AB3Y40_06825 [Yoonia sp. R2331]|uniref:hypothetical protein n=1 Tax=Yoonia sp. R2331 TaxID=3237238 RepID=UPI0034E5C478
MATFEEVMQAAVNAERAGDTDAARQLVQEAQRIQSVTRNQSIDNAVATMTPSPVDGGARVGPRPDRFGDTIAAATEAPREAFGQFAGGLTGGESPTRNALPDDMNWQLKSRLGFMGDAAGAAVSGLGTAYAAGAGLIGETFGGTPHREKQLARDLMMMGEVAAPELAGISSTTRAASSAIRAADALPAAATDLQRQARAADDLGITPTLGMTGRTGATAAATLEKIPVAGNSIANDAARFVGEAEGVFARNAASVGLSTNANSAGSQLQAGLNRFVDRFRGKSNELYQAVDETMPQGVTIQAPETVARIRAALEPFADNPEISAQLGLDKWARLADDLESGISWQAARDLRSNIGESIGKMSGPLADRNQGRMKEAYASLTADLDAAVQQAGPDAVQAWNRANSYYRAGSQRISDQLDRAISADSPERAFEAFAAMTRDRSGGANSTRLLRIKQSLGEDEWREVSGTIVERMGRATDGAQNADGDTFSPGTFLTNWNRMSDEAKRILLPNDVRSELHKLAEVAEASKTANAERNFSNTGGINAGLVLGYGVSTAPTTTALIASGAVLTARSMTNTTFLRAMNRAARGDARQLRAMANGNGPFSRDAATVLRLSAAEAAAPAASANSANAPQAARLAQ